MYLMMRAVQYIMYLFLHEHAVLGIPADRVRVRAGIS